MRKLLFIAFTAIIALFAACTGGSRQGGSSGTAVFKKAGGDRYYGGVFRLNETDFISNIFPPVVKDAVSSNITLQVFEGLVKFAQDSLTIIPSLAESWSVDETGKVYTFKIRKGVKFQDDACFPGGKGRELTARDCKESFEIMCTQMKEENLTYRNVFQDKVTGANKYYEASSGGKPGFDLEGVKMLDDYTLQITLTEPYSSFLYVLAMPNTGIFPKEAYEKYGLNTMVGTGPFKVNKIEKNKWLVLEKNPWYYKKDEFGNQLPFLDSIIVYFMGDKKKEVDEFKKGSLDMTFRIPTEYIIDILEAKYDPATKKSKQFIQQRSSEMRTEFYRFLNINSVFAEKKVRQAFSYAVDKQLILDKALDGEAFAPGVYGITPPVIPGYDVTKIKGYTLDIKKAKELLAKAGYPDGKNFPKISLVLNKGGGIHERVGEEVKRQLKDHLNIDIELNYVELQENITLASQGKSVFSRFAWIADYPSPQTFLDILYGKNVSKDLAKESYPNTSRYINPKFDELYEKGMKARNVEERNKYFMEAEQLAMEDAPVMILWYTENYRILQPYVRNFNYNSMDYRDFSEVWFDMSAHTASAKK